MMKNYFDLNGPGHIAVKKIAKKIAEDVDFIWNTLCMDFCILSNICTCISMMDIKRSWIESPFVHGLSSKKKKRK